MIVLPGFATLVIVYFENCSKCCGCRNESSWTEAVLFDEKGFQLTYSEVEEEFEGPWELEYNGVHYCVDVRPDTADSK